MGKRHLKKDLLAIVAAHHIPYAATATVAYPQDLKQKIRRALEIQGPTMVQIHSPCPLGWRHEAVEEGILFHPHTTINRLLLRGHEHVVGVELVSLEKLPNRDGVIRRLPFEGTERVLEADMVMPAIGERVDRGPLASLLPEGLDRVATADPWGGLPDEPDVFVGGDARGRGSIAASVADDARAALAIAQWVRKGQRPDSGQVETIGFDELNTAYFDRSPRIEPDRVPPAKRRADTEIERGLSEAQAHAEAQRCLSCGNCLACDTCWTICPDNAVVKLAQYAVDASAYDFDYDFCKGCGLCAHECPTGYIAMESEP